MDKIFEKVINNNFSDLKGTVIDASVLVPEYLINEMIQAALQGNKSIESCPISVHGQNRVSANVKTTLLPWSLNLKLKLDSSVDFASYSSPKIRAWLENNILLGRLGSFLNALPDGVKLYGQQIVLDIGAFFQTPEQKRMLDLVKSVGIRTEESKVILDVKIEID
ncbi:MAG TPA: hypothetical protein VF918_15850 [Anaerolineales bacterium]